MFCHLHRFACQHTLVNIGVALTHRSVDRDSAARLHEDDVAGVDVFDVDKARASAVVEHGCVGWLQVDKRADGRRCAVFGLFLEQPPCQHKRHNHRRGVEIYVVSHAVLGGKVGKRYLEYAEHPCRCCAESNERVHICRALLDHLPSPFVESPSAVGERYGCNYGCCPLPCGLCAERCHRNRHNGYGCCPCRRKSDDVVPILFAAQFFLVDVAVGHKAVAGSLHGGLYLLYVDYSWIEMHCQFVGGEIHFRDADAFQGLHGALHIAGADHATHIGNFKCLLYHNAKSLV